MAATRVLVVDDNEGGRVGVRLYLEATGYEVHDAADCATAIRLLEAHSFDVCVLDYSLPDGTALHVLSRMGELGKKIRTIVLTAYPSAEHAEAVVRAGASSFLKKPVDLATLRTMIDAAGDASHRTA